MFYGYIINEGLFKPDKEKMKKEFMEDVLVYAIEKPYWGIKNDRIKDDYSFDDIIKLFLNMERNYLTFILVRKIPLLTEYVKIPFSPKEKIQLEVIEEYEIQHMSRVREILNILRKYPEFKDYKGKLFDATVKELEKYPPFGVTYDKYTRKSQNAFLQYHRIYSSRVYN